MATPAEWQIIEAAFAGLDVEVPLTALDPNTQPQQFTSEQPPHLSSVGHESWPQHIIAGCVRKDHPIQTGKAGAKLDLVFIVRRLLGELTGLKLQSGKDV
ncbi:hypothetical protein ACVSQB_13145 [Bradyrhizobium elkanii]